MMKPSVPVFRRLTAVTCLFLAGTASQLLAQGSESYIVQFRSGTPEAARQAAVAGAGAAVSKSYHGVSAAAVRIPNAQALSRLQNNPAVLSIVPDRPVFASQSARANGGGNGKPG